MIAPERVDLRIGVPLLLAFIPQNVFYTMNNDVLSPLCFGAVFLCVLQWLRVETASVALGAVTGVAIRRSVPCKIVELTFDRSRSGRDRCEIAAHYTAKAARRAGALATLVVCAAIPIGSWMVWRNVNSGIPTGSTEKIALLGWTRKPFVDWWQHPIFSTPWSLGVLVGFDRDLLAR